MSFTHSTSTVEIIEKEELGSMHFATEDVLPDEAARQRSATGSVLTGP